MDVAIQSILTWNRGDMAKSAASHPMLEFPGAMVAIKIL